MADLICRLYEQKVPVRAGSHTTYNAGIAEGGTSVNTIAQNAKFLYEYRSDSAECLALMKASFEEIIQKAKEEGKAEICEKYSGESCVGVSGSTDCNIPVSMGIPAIAFGCCMESGAHTREEKVLLSSIPIGMKIAAEVILGYFYS